MSQGSILDPCLQSIHGPHCLSHNFTRLEKVTLVKQTSQLSLIKPLLMGSVCKLFGKLYETEGYTYVHSKDYLFHGVPSWYIIPC